MYPVISEEIKQRLWNMTWLPGKKQKKFIAILCMMWMGLVIQQSEKF